MSEYYGGLVIDASRCAYCAAWPESPCALHYRDPQPDAVNPDCQNRAPHPRHTLTGGKPTEDKTCYGREGES